MKDSQHGDELILVKAREGASQQRHSDKDVERSCLTSLCIANPVARCTGVFNRKARTLSNRCEDEREMVRVVAGKWSGTGSPGAESARGTVVGRPGWPPGSRSGGQKAAQHPGGFFMHLHALGQQVGGGFVADLFPQGGSAWGGPHHGSLALDQEFDQVSGGWNALVFLDRRQARMGCIGAWRREA